jgi:ProQ C-terminal domain
MDIRTLKVNQRVCLQFHSRFKEATVTEITKDYVRVEVAETEKDHCYYVDFDYDGIPIAMWGWIDAWRPCSRQDGDYLKIIKSCA